MKRISVVGIVVFLMAAALSGCSGIDFWRLQGTWEATVTVGQATIVTHRLIIDDSDFEFIEYTLLPVGKQGTFSSNVFSNPRTIDFSIDTEYVGEGSLQVVQTNDPPAALYGIYKISKDELTIQFGDASSRPESFDEDAITLKRVSTD